MARKRKDGRRAEGIQGRKGRLYYIITQQEVIDGKKISKRVWCATGLPDKDENISKAVEMREKRLSSAGSALSVDREVPMKTYVNLYLAKKRRTIADTTYSGYFYRGNRIIDFFDEIKVRSVSKVNVEQFMDHLITDCESQERTVKDIKTLLSGIMDQAVKDGLIAINPVKEATMNKTLVLKHAKVKNDDDDFFSFKEAQLFLAIAESHELYELFFVTLFFGLRREEVLGLRWSCVDFDAKEFRVNHTVTKGMTVNRVNSTKTATSARTYPLTEEQVKMFKHLKAKETENRDLFGSAYHDNDYIFKHEDGSLYYPDYPTKAFGKLIKAHPELPQGITFHGLRKSCVSILVHEGYDVKRIQKWVGHADIDTTLKIYAKVKDKEAKQEILNGMNNIIKPKSYAN
jgi:integrase